MTTITTAGTPRPISKPNGVFPFVDLSTGCLTEHGLQLMNQYHAFIVGMNRIIPCNASGTNVVTLTPLDASPLIEKYSVFDVFAFAAENTSGAAVTMLVVTRNGALATLKAYKTNGAAQAGAGDVVAGSLYFATYADHLDGGAGGLVLK